MPRGLVVGLRRWIDEVDGLDHPDELVDLVGGGVGTVVAATTSRRPSTSTTQIRLVQPAGTGKGHEVERVDHREAVHNGSELLRRLELDEVAGVTVELCRLGRGRCDLADRAVAPARSRVLGPTGSQPCRHGSGKVAITELKRSRRRVSDPSGKPVASETSSSCIHPVGMSTSARSRRGAGEPHLYRSASISSGSAKVPRPGMRTRAEIEMVLVDRVRGLCLAPVVVDQQHGGGDGGGHADGVRRPAGPPAPLRAPEHPLELGLEVRCQVRRRGGEPLAQVLVTEHRRSPPRAEPRPADRAPGTGAA